MKITWTLRGCHPNLAGGKTINLTGGTVGECKREMRFRKHDGWKDLHIVGRDEDDEDEDRYIHTACGICGQDIGGDLGGDEWRDRGGNTECVPFIVAGVPHRPEPGSKHRPTL